MPFTWSLDSTNWDLTISDGKLDQVYGIEEIKQRILVSLWHYWEEYFLNVPAGMPWYELILGSKNKALVESLIRRAILDVPGVISIVHCKLQSPTVGSVLRDFAIFCTVEVNGGTVSIFTTNPTLLSTEDTSVTYLTTNAAEYLTTNAGEYLIL